MTVVDVVSGGVRGGDGGGTRPDENKQAGNRARKTGVIPSLHHLVPRCHSRGLEPLQLCQLRARLLPHRHSSLGCLLNFNPPSTPGRLPGVPVIIVDRCCLFNRSSRTKCTHLSWHDVVAGQYVNTSDFVLVRVLPWVGLFWAKCVGRESQGPGHKIATRSKRTSSPLDRSVADALLLPPPQCRPLFGVPLRGENDPRDFARLSSRGRRRRRPFWSIVSPPLPSLLPSRSPLPALRPLALFLLFLSREPSRGRCRPSRRLGDLLPWSESFLSRGETGFALLLAPARPVTTVAAAVPTEPGEAGTVDSSTFPEEGEEVTCVGSAAAGAAAVATSFSSSGERSGGS